MKKHILARLIGTLSFSPLFLICSSALAQQASSAKPISLNEAILLAQRNSPQAIQARGLERTSAAARRSATGALLPNFNLSMGRVIQYGGQTTRINSNGEQVAVAQRPTNSTGLSLGMTLFDAGKEFYNLYAARANEDAAEAGTITARYNVALDVKRQYYAVLAALESEDAAKAQMEQARAQLASSVAKVKAGVATRSDSLRGVIQVGNAQLAQITAESNLEVANAALTRLVGSATPVTADPASVNEQFEALPDSAALSALADRGPAVKQAEANVAAAKQLRRASKTSYFPTLSANYSRSGTGVDSRFGLGSDPFAYNGRLSFSLSYPLFNGFTREEQVARADVAEENAAASLRDAQLAADQLLAQYLGSLRGASARVAVQRASVAAAEEDVRVQQQRYNIGASTLLDLLISQTTLEQARVALIAARYDYRIARAQIETLIGQDLR
jgi:outer membrane protein